MLEEWAEYERIEPFGAWRDNWHAALVASLIARTMGGKSLPLSEFFYVDGDTRREQQDAQTLAMFEALADKTHD